MITDPDSGYDSDMEEIMGAYGTELSIFAYSYVKNRETAKDLVQNAFIKCYQHLSGFEDKDKIRAWLYAVTMNECKDYLRSSYFRRVIVGHETAEETFSSAETEAISKLNEERLIGLMMKLPVKYKEVLILHLVNELEVKEISAALMLPSNTVKTRVRRAKEKLALLAKKEGFFIE